MWHRAVGQDRPLLGGVLAGRNSVVAGADTVIHDYSHPFRCNPAVLWNPAAEAQAADRAHRIGQDKPVFVHRLVARNTVDERILALQEKKRGLADAVVSAGGGGLTREDLLDLLA